MIEEHSDAILAWLRAKFPEVTTLTSEEDARFIADNLETVITKRGEKDINVRLLLGFLKHTERLDEERLRRIVSDIGRVKHREKMDQFIAEYGFAIQGVYSNEEDNLPFSYTVGLSGKTGFELIAIAKAPVKILADAVSFFANLALNGGNVTAVHTGDTLQCRLPNGTSQDLRMKAVLVDAEEVRRKHILDIRQETFNVYQVFLADKNNILPGEVGYGEDAKLTQPHFTPMKLH